MEFQIALSNLFEQDDSTDEHEQQDITTTQTTASEGMNKSIFNIR